jgi:tRNA dimethylallyltransferase
LGGRLVTRQLTWFRDNSLFKWVDSDAGEDVVGSILRELGRPTHLGGSGDYGRLSKEEQSAVKRYVARLQTLDDHSACVDVLRRCRQCRF